MKSLKVVALLLMAAIAIAQELPAVVPVFPERTLSRSDASEPLLLPGPSQPVWHQLAHLTPAERANASIDVELPAGAPAEALTLARLIADTWNRGQFETALNLFESLARLVNPLEIAIGCSWRQPIPSPGTDWGTDVRVGTRDSIYAIQLDIHRESGNLLAVLASKSGDYWYVSMNLSTDGGTSWSETYTVSSTIPAYSALNAVVVGGDCYFAYELNRLTLRLRRCYASNGTQHMFQGGLAYVDIANFTGADSIRQIAICSNQDYYNNRLYVLPLLFSGRIRFYWDDTAAVSWDSTPDPGITNARHGIDASCNEGFTSTFIWVSYVGTDSLVNIIGSEGTSWRNFINYPSDPDPANANTAISAWKDTVLCAFLYPGPVATHVRYLVNYQGGNADWYYGNVGNDTTTRAESPDVTLRDGGGAAIIYRYYSSPREMRFVWRRYRGFWSTPVSAADYEPYWNHPAVEYLGADVYGVLYLTWRTPQVRAAYFDRTDWTGITEQRQLIMAENILNVTPNPLSGTGWLHYTLNRPARLTVQVFDRAGRLVSTVYNGQSAAGRQSLRFDAGAFSPGVYFLRADADGEALTVPFTVVH
jgi:hypothetical protein